MQKLTAYNSTGQPIQELELSKTESIPLTFQLADVRKPGTKSGLHSKTLVLPGTEINNKFFGGHYDVNVDTQAFNPNVKTFIVLTSGDEEVISGHMQLKVVTKNDKGFITYDVLLFDTTVEMWSQVKDLKVVGNEDSTKDIVFTAAEGKIDMDHIWNKENIALSWAADWDTLGYTNRLFNTGSTQNVSVEELRPAIFHKNLLDRILHHHGFSWSGSLKTDTTYEREIIPYTDELPQNSVTIAQGHTFKGGRSVDDSIYSSAVNTGAISENELSILFNNEANPTYGFDDTNGLWNSIDTFTAPISARYDLKHLFNLEVNMQWRRLTIHPAFSNLSHQVQFRAKAKVFDNLGVFQYETLPFSLGQTNLLITATTEGGTVGVSFNSIDTIAPTTATTANASTAGPPVITATDFALDAGWKVQFFLEATCQGVLKTGTPYSGIGTQFIVENITLSTLAGSYVESALNTYTVGEHSLVPFSQWISADLTQTDVIQDIIKRYNCFVYPNPDNPKDVVFDTGATFYSSGNTVDWSKKKDLNTRDKITQIGTLQQKKLLLTYKQGKDLNNVTYKKSTDEVWGQYEHTFGNEFVKGTKKVETPFESTPLVVRGPSWGVIVSDISYASTDIGNRVLYAPSGLTFSGWFAANDSNYFKIVGRNFVTGVEEPVLYDNAETGEGLKVMYPYAGHLNTPTLFASNQAVLDINFGQVVYYHYSFQDSTLIQPVVNLESLYWQNAIDQLTSGKLQHSSFELNSRDAALVRKEPNLKVWVDNAYWLINKMTFEGNDDLRGLTKVELVTLVNNQASKLSTKPMKPSVNIITDLKPFIERNIISSNAINTTINGENNEVGDFASNIMVNGNGNKIGSKAANVTIQGGDNNIVRGSNVTLINTSGLVVVSDNITIIENVIVSGGANTPVFNVVDGGEDELRTDYPAFTMNLIDGGEDKLLNPFSVSPVKTLDSENGTNII